MKRIRVRPISMTSIPALGLAILFALFVFHFIGCEKKLEGKIDGPLTFEVKFASGQTGSASRPLDFSIEPMNFVLSVRAISDDGGTAKDVNREVHLNIAPTGKLAHGQRPWIQMKNGMAENVQVSVQYIHSPSYIWVEDTGTDEQPRGCATGLSPAIYVKNPTIRNVQETDRPTSSPLMGDFVEMLVGDRKLVVTGLTVDGFYVTDVSESEGIYNSIFAYNFSRPGDLAEGDRIGQLSGVSDEYYGFTELNFPSWRVAEKGLALPDPVLITGDIVANDTTMEQYESSLVEVRSVTVCPVTEDYQTYGQWAVLLTESGDCTGDGAINVVSASAAPDFDPARHAGDTVSRIRGNLRFHSSAKPSWMIYVRKPSDIEL